MGNRLRTKLCAGFTIEINRQVFTAVGNQQILGINRSNKKYDEGSCQAGDNSKDDNELAVPEKVFETRFLLCSSRRDAPKLLAVQFIES